MTQLSNALAYLNRGFSVIPVRPDKKPFIRWEAYQNRRPTEDEIRQWWTKWPNAMIGIVTGSISGIDIMDTDSQEADEELQSYLSDSFVCPTQRTPGGGKHYLFVHRAFAIATIDPLSSFMSEAKVVTSLQLQVKTGPGDVMSGWMA